ncbi:MAG: hypothetical protein B7Z52_01050, partial [Burkholderiales bacterium 12-64-5]
MAENKQAYTGFAGLGDVNSEWNRLQFAIRSVMNGMATTTLVIVKAVNGDTIDAQPMVAQTDGAGNAVPHGTIHGMPIWRLQGGTSAVIVTPAVGDIGLAVFAHSDISAVKRAKEPTTPGSARKFDWSDGIYLGGLLNAVPTQFVQMDETGIKITADANLPIAITAPAQAVIGHRHGEDTAK